jgi:anti-sigma-K factor RskA
VTSPKQSKEDRSADQLLAGKYVLGLLSDEGRRSVEDRMRRDRSFAHIVMQWARNASSTDEQDRFDVLGRGVAGRPSHTRLHVHKRDLLMLAGWHVWRSAAVWRITALLLFVLVLTLLAL